MKRLLFFLIFVFLNAQSFSDYKKAQLREFNNYKISLNKAFEEYKNDLNKGFKEYKKELSNYWKNPELTTKKVFVEYSKNKKVRKKVDYEKGVIIVSVISKNSNDAKEAIRNALKNLAVENTENAVNKNPVLSKVIKTMNEKYKNQIVFSNPSNEPIVGDILFKNKITQKKVKKFVNKSLQKPLKISASKIKNEKVYKLTVILPPDYILIKAKRYKADVFKRANEFGLTPSLIYAIIQTESSYNPLARSYIPAFGLMQIVPATAGRDAYEMLYKKPKLLSPDYLYNSHNNILIGSAYLNKVFYRYFRGIKDPASRLYCTIAAYNTGVGNVACAFNSISKDYKGRTICKRNRGDYSIKKALFKINSMKPKEVYYYLLKNLRYDEGKNYLKKVTARYILYLHSLRADKI